MDGARDRGDREACGVVARREKRALRLERQPGLRTTWALGKSKWEPGKVLE